MLMNLSQLMPEALSLAIKESVSGSSGGGVGLLSLLASSGAGGGAAGAGGGTGSQGDVVSAFDGDHETPELIWNATCRHELRAALGELCAGLSGLRKRAAAGGAAGGADGCGWTLPASFRVRFSTCEGELRCGGVYVRLFLKEPTFPLRDPKGFLEALLRRFQAEADHLVGMTSEDAEKVRAATAAAADAAKAEAASGGVGMKTRATGEEASEGQAMVIRGEDVLTQLTHGIVCLLRVRSILCETVAQLGYVGRIVGNLTAAQGKLARYNLGIQCVRVLQVLAPVRACLPALGKARAVDALLKAVAPPLPRDAAFFLECIKLLLETDSAMDSTTYGHDIVRAALQADAIGRMVGILEKEKLDHLVDESAARVHAVAILKTLENDPVHQMEAAAALAGHSQAWDKYRHQKHDLFLSRNDTRDYFLTDVATAAPAFMLKNTAEWEHPAGGGGGGGGGAAAEPPASSFGSRYSDSGSPPPGE
jgi:DnaJ family protein C protein 13